MSQKMDAITEHSSQSEEDNLSFFTEK